MSVIYKYLKKHLINLRLTTKEVKIEELVKAFIKDQEKLFKEVKRNKIINEFLLLQKCNCVELYFVTNDISKNIINSLIKVWVNHAIQLTPELQSKIVKVKDLEASYHLIKIATSLESLVIGDAQVLGQVREARKIANKMKTLGPIFDLLLKYVDKAGSRVRTETKLCVGNVSVASVTANIIFDFFRKNPGKILIIGVGKMGKIIAELLINKIQRKYVFVTDIVQKKAEMLAKKLKVNVQKFDSYKRDLHEYQYIVFTATSLQYLLDRSDIKTHLPFFFKKVIIIDIGNPLCVDPGVTINNNLILLNLDYVQNVGSKNLAKRNQEMLKAEKIAKEEFEKFKQEIKSLGVQQLIREIYKNAYFQCIEYVEKLIKKSYIPKFENQEHLELLVHGLIARSLSKVARLRNLAQKNFFKAKEILTFLAQEKVKK
jgi:glutamyl-tRNA reductase